MKFSLRILLLSSLLVPTAHLAAVLIDGIQIYDESAKDLTKSGFELRVNTTLKGWTAPDYRSGITPQHVIQLTPVAFHKLSEGFEMGLHRPLVYARPDSAVNGENLETNNIINTAFDFESRPRSMGTIEQ